ALPSLGPKDRSARIYFDRTGLRREAELLKELDYIRQEKQKLMAERNEYETHGPNKSKEDLFTF
ncbi:MAG: hypothetical protein IJ994_07115, partial [Firmicutes bacterium]|nr:hypothetical protein [Bacillota bacterium]